VEKRRAHLSAKTTRRAEFCKFLFEVLRVFHLGLSLSTGVTFSLQGTPEKQWDQKRNAAAEEYQTCESEDEVSVPDRDIKEKKSADQEKDPSCQMKGSFFILMVHKPERSVLNEMSWREEHVLPRGTQSYAK
jgi:hypothetical protein